MPGNVRAVYAYELHGHDSEGALNYQEFFDGLAELDPRQRSHKLRDDSKQVVAIPEINRAGTRFRLRFVSGREGDPAIFYDLRTATEREAAPRDNEMPINYSWVILDTDSRIVVQERRRPGVPLVDIVAALGAIGRQYELAPNPTISLHPVVGEGFVEEVDGLVRITSASVVVSQPNHSWTKSVNSIIADLGQESHGGSAELTVAARPKESLNSDAGIVKEIQAMVKNAFSALRSASIVGYREGDERATTVSTRKYAQRREVPIPAGATRAQEQQAVLSGADRYLDELAQTHAPQD